MCVCARIQIQIPFIFSRYQEIPKFAFQVDFTSQITHIHPHSRLLRAKEYQRLSSVQFSSFDNVLRKNYSLSRQVRLLNHLKKFDLCLEDFYVSKLLLCFKYNLCTTLCLIILCCMHTGTFLRNYF